MKRFGQLFEQIVSWENLSLAARLAARRKPMTAERANFEYRLENELTELRNVLIQGSYTPGEYRTFTIYDPKKRLISAAPYRDRVVHHALCNIIEPLFDRSFLPQNYANRKGRGLHKAVKAGSWIINSSDYLLKADIRKYFPCIDHEILKVRIRRKIKCLRTLALMDTIIDGSCDQEPVNFYFAGDDLFTPYQRSKGLPIGNLTSQLFANIYLDDLDHYIVHHLGYRRYTRYVDDILIGANDKKALQSVKKALGEYLDGIRLKLHPHKSTVFAAIRGLTFLGFRLYPGKILAGKRCGKRFKKRLKHLQKQYAHGQTDLKSIKQVIAAYNGHLAHGATEKLRMQILQECPFVHCGK